MEAFSSEIVSLYETCENIQHLALVDGAFEWLLCMSTPSLPDHPTAKLSAPVLAQGKELHLTFLNKGSDQKYWVYIARNRDIQCCLDLLDPVNKGQSMQGQSINDRSVNRVNQGQSHKTTVTHVIQNILPHSNT